MKTGIADCLAISKLNTEKPQIIYCVRTKPENRKKWSYIYCGKLFVVFHWLTICFTNCCYW